MKSALYSIAGYSRMLDGAGFDADIISSRDGVTRFKQYPDLREEIEKLTSQSARSVLGEAYSAILGSTLTRTEFLGERLENTTLDSGIDFSQAGNLGAQFREVAKVMRLDSGEFQTERGAYYTSIGGWDSHHTCDITKQLKEVNDAIEVFVKELKYQDLWNKVAIVLTSDFGRTLTTNSQGTDHAWAGMYFVIGGGVRGGQMLGRYPPRLDDTDGGAEHSLNLGRGRLVPTTPWESVWNAVAEWWGLDAQKRAQVLPHLANFANTSTIFTKMQLFKRADMLGNAG